jgi:hypothetical protein
VPAVAAAVTAAPAGAVAGAVVVVEQPAVPVVEQEPYHSTCTPQGTHHLHCPEATAGQSPSSLLGTAETTVVGQTRPAAVVVGADLGNRFLAALGPYSFWHLR